jgi:hypothetical protein
MLSVRKVNSHNLQWAILNLGTIFWGFVWAAFFEYCPSIVAKLWSRLTPGKQYLLAVIPLFIIIALPLTELGLFLSQYVGSTIGMGIPTLLFLFLYSPSNPDAPLKRLIDKTVTARTLYRNYRTRTCNICDHYDPRTRDITKPAEMYDSAFIPCEKCGSNDFKLHRLD